MTAFLIGLSTTLAIIAYTDTKLARTATDQDCTQLLRVSDTLSRSAK